MLNDKNKDSQDILTQNQKDTHVASNTAYSWCRVATIHHIHGTHCSL